MDLIQVGTIIKTKEEDVIKLIKDSTNPLPIRIINEKTGVSYNVIKRIIKEAGYKIQKEPYPGRRKYLCAVKNNGDKDSIKV